MTATPASNAVVTVTANRKAMIRVDGVPKGYPPLSLALSPGSYQISATMPNRADTEQSKTVTVKKGQALNVGFVF